MHHVALSVKDLDASLIFYKDLLGTKEGKSFERKDLGGRAVFLVLDNIQLELWQPYEQKPNKDDLTDLNTRGIRHIAFEFDDLDAKYKELKAKGIDIDEPAPGASVSKLCQLRDPDGMVVELYQKQ
ncbi:Glyoxalase/Bleomycin resistance protein/Dioxygenase superfamily protein [uncultured archaeon]|nr:Glyoxalase/Bleomycin resistance protein/Dioxygenase superfamily protein [uncultured archaeon]